MQTYTVIGIILLILGLIITPIDLLKIPKSSDFKYLFLGLGILLIVAGIVLIIMPIKEGFSEESGEKIDDPEKKKLKVPERT